MAVVKPLGPFGSTVSNSSNPRGSVSLNTHKSQLLPRACSRTDERSVSSFLKAAMRRVFVTTVAYVLVFCGFAARGQLALCNRPDSLSDVNMALAFQTTADCLAFARNFSVTTTQNGWVNGYPVCGSGTAGAEQATPVFCFDVPSQHTVPGLRWAITSQPGTGVMQFAWASLKPSTPPPWIVSFFAYGAFSECGNSMVPGGADPSTCGCFDEAGDGPARFYGTCGVLQAAGSTPTAIRGIQSST